MHASAATDGQGGAGALGWGVPWNPVFEKESPIPSKKPTPTLSRSEVAGDFYLIIIMVILMIIIILHHGADDYNHMGMQWALQLGLHDGGY